MRIIFSCILFFNTLVAVGQESSLPHSVRVPLNSRLIWHTYAKGVQVYTCTQDPKDTTNYIWTFKEPRANLYADTGYRQLVGKHYFDSGKHPTWETADGSKVSGIKVQQVDSPDSTAIPWLLLQSAAGSGSGTLTHTAFIQRLRTNGGKAPARSDRQHLGQSVEVAYTAEYLFYSN